MKVDVSIIIINYNCDAYLKDCITSIEQCSNDISYEIILVDNDSTDDSVQHVRELFPQVIIIENRKNLGFGAANNVGAKRASGQYLLLLNPDTIMLNNAPKLFFDFANNKKNLGCCGGNLLDIDKQSSNIGGNFPSLFQLFSDIGFRVFYKQYYKKHVSLMLTIDDLAADNKIDCVCGADLFIAADLFKEIGGFDEDYFLYYEDTDLCYRLNKAGFDQYILPAVKILHLESVIISDNKTEKLNMRKFSFFERGKQLFFRKSFGLISVISAKVLTVLYIFTRLLAHRGNVHQYLKMMYISLKMKTK